MLTNLVGLPRTYCVNAQHIAALRESGLSDETIQSARVYSATSKQVQRLLGWPAGTGLVFDYGNGYFRVKLDTPQPDRKQYRAPADTPCPLYVPAMLDAAMLQDPTKVLILTEGEKKALRAVQDGLPCVAFPGVWTWSWKHKPGPALDQVVWDGRTVVIMFDADVAWNPNVIDAEARLLHELRTRGAWIFTARLPARTGDKVGLDDFLKNHSLDRLLDLRATEIRSSDVASSHQIRHSLLVIGGQGLCEGNQPLPEKLAQGAVGETTARYLWTFWGNSEPFDMDRLCHSPLDPNKRRKGTRFVMFQGRVLAAVEGSKSYWPQPVFWYHALKKTNEKRGHRGRYKMEKIKPWWIPVWDGLLRIAAGELPFDRVAPYPGLEGEVLTAWRKIHHVRRLRYPGEPTLFDPSMVSVLVQRSKEDVSLAWLTLEACGAVVEVPGDNPRVKLYTEEEDFSCPQLDLDGGTVCQTTARVVAG
jgi:hypothetical protein